MTTGSEQPPPDDAPREPASAAPRRLLRSRDERIIAGVSGGIGGYFNLDPVLVRIAFVLLCVFALGLGLLLYLIAWVLMPLAPTTAPDASAAPTAEARSNRASRGGILLGLLLVIVGAIWLLRAFGVPTLRWDVALAVGLLVVGAALLMGARRRGEQRGALIAVGVVLAGVLTITASVDAIGRGIESGFGDRFERPADVTELADGYRHAFGSMTVDLSRLELPTGTTSIDLSIAFGDLTIVLPADVAVRVEADTVFGSATVFGKESSGVTADSTFRSADYSDAERRLSIDLSTVFGSATVRR